MRLAFEQEVKGSQFNTTFGYIHTADGATLLPTRENLSWLYILLLYEIPKYWKNNLLKLSESIEYSGRGAVKQNNFTLRNIGRWADGNLDIPQRLSLRWIMWIETTTLLDDIPLVTSILTRLKSIEIPDSSILITRAKSVSNNISCERCCKIWNGRVGCGTIASSVNDDNNKLYWNFIEVVTDARTEITENSDNQAAFKFKSTLLRNWRLERSRAISPIQLVVFRPCWGDHISREYLYSYLHL